MKNWFKRLLACSAATCVLLTGCSAPTATDGKTADGKDTANIAMGRYIEEELTLPEGAANIPSFVRKKDGTLEIIYCANTTTPIGPFEMATSPDGKTWTKKDAPWLDNIADSMLASVAYGSDDNMYVRYQPIPQEALDMLRGKTPADKSAEASVAMETAMPPSMDMTVSADGTAAEPFESLKNQDGKSVLYGDIVIAPNGDLIVQDYQNILQYDATTKTIKNTFAYAEGIYNPSFSICGDNLCIDAGTTIQIFDLNTGEKIGDTVPVGDGSEYSPSIPATSSRLGDKMMSASLDNKSLFYSDSSGIYRQVIGGTVSEKLVEGELTSFNMPSLHGVSLIPLGEDSLMALFSSDSGFSLMSYTYSKDTPTVPETELKVYSLSDNKTVRQAMALFQRKHPDVHVIYTVAQSGADSVPVSDLLRTLSTELLAGKGPDILIMDAMPIESYIQKDILMDLSEIVGPGISNREYMENIMNFGKNADGKMYSVPARFSVPVLLGYNEFVDSVNDFSSFISAVKKLQKESADKYDQGVIPTTGSEEMIRQLSDICAPAWFNEGGSLNKESLSLFLSEIKEVTEPADPAVEYTDQMKKYSSRVSSLSMSWAFDHNAMGIGNLTSVDSYAFPTAAIDLKKTGKIKLAPGQISNVFLPSSIVGVNKNTAQKELSAEFINMILSQEVQVNNFDDGMPVNTAAYKKSSENPYASYDDGMSIGIMNPDGTNEIFQVIWPSDEQLAQLDAMIQSLENPSVVDQTIVDVIVTQSKDYFSGAKSLEDTVTAVSKNLEMYLSE